MAPVDKLRDGHQHSHATRALSYLSLSLVGMRMACVLVPLDALISLFTNKRSLYTLMNETLLAAMSTELGYTSPGVSCYEP